MRSFMALILIAALGSSAATAQRGRPTVRECPGQEGESSHPFYGVTAAQAKSGAVTVSGQYRLDVRRGGVSLAQAGSVGDSRILELRLRYLRNHRGTDRCQPFRGLFNVPPVREVRITDWMDRSVKISLH